ncbi:MAG TPA: hypothetical protein VGN88_01690 [Phycisphaerae bacterium]|jgi:hypothetical protein
MQLILIVVLSIYSAIFYGIIHDQITARICVEYFTLGHPPIFHTDDPTLLALGWGVIATWWVGAILGIPLSLAARVGNLPKRTAVSMIKPIGILLLAMALCAALAGTAAYFNYRNVPLPVIDPMAEGIPRDKQLGFMVDLWTHLASYGSGFLGGCVLIVWTLIIRFHAKVRELRSADHAGA